MHGGSSQLLHICVGFVDACRTMGMSKRPWHVVSKRGAKSAEQRQVQPIDVCVD